METDPKTLGTLAYSMLLGSEGNQRKEVKRVCEWLAKSNADLIIFSNILIGGCIDDIKSSLDVPVLVTLQGDDVFLDVLNEPFKTKCITRIKQIVKNVDGFIVQSEFFRTYMSDYFSIDPKKCHVTPLGLDLTDFERFLDRDASHPSETQTIGYMARLAKEKGFHHLVDAFIKLKSMPGTDHIRLLIAGWLGPENKSYADEQWKRLEASGLSTQYEYLGAVERDAKLGFFEQIDLLSVPAEFQEPKGLYALEALAAGVPVVLPAHGAFPELIEQSGGGVLFEPGNTSQLAQSLQAILADDQRRRLFASHGQQFVHQYRSASAMASSTSELIKSFL